MLTNEQVVWLYRCLLGREPESSEAIAQTAAMFPDLTTARAHMMASREFANANMASVFYRHDSSVMPAVRTRSASLALATIVKDEEARIEWMLLSCLPVVDFVALVDTGSADRTLEIARETLDRSGVPYVTRRIEFKNFSQARNQALDLVPPYITWSLMLDADEHLVQEDYWRLNSLLDAPYDGWQLPRFNFFDAKKAEAPRPYPDYQRRLLRNRVDQPIRFSGAVHEQPLNVKTWGYAPASEGGRDGFIGGPHIHHMGQVNLSLERWKQKHDFYSRLGMSVVADGQAVR